MIINQIDPDVEYATRGFSAAENLILAKEMKRRGDRLLHGRAIAPEPSLPTKIKVAAEYLTGVAYWQVRGERGRK